MPILHLEMYPGRTLDQKRAFVREIIRVAVETLNCPPETVDVVMSEAAPENWADVVMSQVTRGNWAKQINNKGR